MNRLNIVIIISLLFYFNQKLSGQLQPGAKQIALSHSDVANPTMYFQYLQIQPD